VTKTATAEADRRFMALALSLGERGQGHVWPNPAVGCVIVRDGVIVGRGWTQAGGRPHAEAMALAQAGDAAQGATAYVTLEPCAHVSPRGPACADLLVAAGVARVVSAMVDPDPRTTGQGHARLAAAGIAVTSQCLADVAQLAHRGFRTRLAAGRPHVTLKLATTLDGRIATAAGESRWITGAAARRDVHALRLRSDAVAVGIGTALADDPDLRVRDLGVTHQPVRVVLDSHLRLPLTSRLAQSPGQGPVWVVHRPKAEDKLRKALLGVGVRLIEADADPQGRLDPTAALQVLGAAGLNAVLCEGGSAVASALLSAGLVDEIVLYQAGRVFGAGGTAAVGDMPHAPLAGMPPGFRLVDHADLGGDLRSVWRNTATG
jgi:diaminohydroxyphosphoribosylaminopyrimidine deaminase/5-amino-6-(5-phosphoribosylamino)uracil reductase